MPVLIRGVVWVLLALHPSPQKFRAGKRKSKHRGACFFRFGFQSIMLCAKLSLGSTIYHTKHLFNVVIHWPNYILYSVMGKIQRLNALILYTNYPQCTHAGNGPQQARGCFGIQSTFAG
jgi:hypothetical protein